MNQINFYTWIQEAQDFVLRLFVEPSSGLSKRSSSYYTCAHCGTYARIHH